MVVVKQLFQFQFLKHVSSVAVALLVTFSSVIVCAQVVSSAAQIEVLRQKAYEYQVNQQWDKALAVYVKALKLDPSSAQINNDLGLVYEQLGMDEKAKGYYFESIRLNAQYLPAYTNLGFLYKRQQNYIQALRYFQKRVNLGQADDSWTLMAYEQIELIYNEVDFLKDRRFQESVDRFENQVVQEQWDDFERSLILADEAFQRGVEFLKQDQFQKAAELFQKALTFSPDNPKYERAFAFAEKEYQKAEMQLHYSRAITSLEEGKIDLAQKNIQEILDILPNEK